MISHIVLFTPKAELPRERRLAFAQSVLAALREIPSVQRATVGKKIDVDSGYDRDFGGKTYEFASVLEFQDETGLRDYLLHPLHAVLGRLFWENCEATVISEVRAVDLLDPDAASVLAD